ncbi:MAG: ABC transporter substrate-binding protein, partial [Kiloniellales bacterium]|nr:ABC transporter substrate-binding protein [Kiloniellales bacterium]
MARLTAALLTLSLLVFQAATTAARADDWNAILEEARGQTVFWNAWGGDERINAYIAWVGTRIAEDHGVTLRHVKLT